MPHHPSGLARFRFKAPFGAVDRRGARLALPLAAALLVPVIPEAAPLVGVPARSTIAYTCRTGIPDVIESATIDNVPGAFSAGCDVTGSTSFGSGQAVAHGLTTFGYPAAADVQTSFSGTSGRGEARITALVDLKVVLQQTAAPPVAATAIPVTVEAPYSMTASVLSAGSGGGSGAFVSLWIVGGDLPYAITLTDQLNIGSSSLQATKEGTLRWKGNLTLDDENPYAGGLDLRISARCVSSLFSAYGGEFGTDCQAIIDPLFGFDQDAFDALMGIDTFQLADYFAFGLSENLGQPLAVVPLPAPALLFLSACAVLAGFRRYRVAPGA